MLAVQGKAMAEDSFADGAASEPSADMDCCTAAAQAADNTAAADTTARHTLRIADILAEADSDTDSAFRNQPAVNNRIAVRSAADSYIVVQAAAWTAVGNCIAARAAEDNRIAVRAAAWAAVSSRIAAQAAEAHIPARPMDSPGPVFGA